MVSVSALWFVTYAHTVSDSKISSHRHIDGKLRIYLTPMLTVTPRNFDILFCMKQTKMMCSAILTQIKCERGTD